jgi:hypothetical protein
LIEAREEGCLWKSLEQRKLAAPERSHCRIANFGKEAIAIRALDEESPEIEKRPTLGVLEERKDCVPQDRSHLVAPRRREPAENRDEIGRKEFLLPFSFRAEYVESDWRVLVRWIEEHDLITSRIGNEREHFIREVTMRIEQTEASTSFDVFADKVFE